jgi:hypothetical protein
MLTPRRTKARAARAARRKERLEKQAKNPPVARRVLARPAKEPPTDAELEAQIIAALRSLDRGRIAAALKALRVPQPDGRDFRRRAHELRLKRPEFTAEERAASQHYLEEHPAR